MPQKAAFLDLKALLRERHVTTRLNPWTLQPVCGNMIINQHTPALLRHIYIGGSPSIHEIDLIIRLHTMKEGSVVADQVFDLPFLLLQEDKQDHVLEE